MSAHKVAAGLKEAIEHAHMHDPKRSAIALCCLNSAAMLDLADQGIHHKADELARIRAANHAQAQFLRVAAELADEMADALQEFVDATIGRDPHIPCELTTRAVAILGKVQP